MINNRQNRRRGRGGQQNRGGPRNDNRSRGNAAQLLEKYKGLARDAQMSGDRVQAEYYLQFADHYFRVLEDHKSKQDDQPAPRPKGRRQDSDDAGSDNGEENRGNKADDEPKPRRSRRTESDGETKPKTPRRRAAPKDDNESGNGEDNAIAADALPPAIGADEGEEKPKPSRRRKTSDDGDAASAA